MAANDDLPPPKQPNPKPLPVNRDFLRHLEAYLAKRDGVDKLLKISRYATKIILASSAIPETLPIHKRLKSFESSVGLSRKAFRLGKFVQDVNALRHLIVVLRFAGGNVPVDRRLISAWAEFVGYLGSISLKIRDLRILSEDEACLISSIEMAKTTGISCVDEESKLKKLRAKEDFEEAVNSSGCC
ncbi:unnamed protein product [Rhodiola kirilowii]